ncbi:hypothetical protein D3C74_69330 [compost metagenome]
MYYKDMKTSMLSLILTLMWQKPWFDDFDLFFTFLPPVTDSYLLNPSTFLIIYKSPRAHNF